MDWHGLAIDFNISVNDPLEIVFIIVYYFNQINEINSK